ASHLCRSCRELSSAADRRPRSTASGPPLRSKPAIVRLRPPFRHHARTLARTLLSFGVLRRRMLFALSLSLAFACSNGGGDANESDAGTNGSDSDASEADSAEAGSEGSEGSGGQDLPPEGLDVPARGIWLEKVEASQGVAIDIGR